MSDVEHTTEVVDDQETDQVLQQVKLKKKNINLPIANMKISHEILNLHQFSARFFNNKI